MTRYIDYQTPSDFGGYQPWNYPSEPRFGRDEVEDQKLVARFLQAVAYIGLDDSTDAFDVLYSKYSLRHSLRLYRFYKKATGRSGSDRVPESSDPDFLEMLQYYSQDALPGLTYVDGMKFFLDTMKKADPNWFSKYCEEIRMDTEVNQSGKLESATDKGYPDNQTIPAENGNSSSTWNLRFPEGLATVSLYDQWFAPPVSGPCPRGRYKHGAAVTDDKMYIYGGVYNGCHLDDLQVLDLKSWTWTRVEVKASPDGSFASHSLIAWEGDKLLAVGHHVKDPLGIMQVKVFDLQTCSWSTLKIYGKPPVSRDGYSATLMGVSLIIFGGQDAKQSFSNDLHILDLETMNWGKVDTLGVPPSPRSDHVAAVHADRYLFVFGGCSHATCFNDLHVLDLQTKEWSRPAQKGEIPSPRAGHAGVTVGELWFIFGGGDHKRGVSQSVVLNMSTLVWSVIKRVQGFASLAREGLTSVLGSYNGEDVLVFFGGYDGQYTNQVDLAKL